MKKYLVIGNPIEHSLSPLLHNFWIKKNDIDAVYDKKKLVEKNLQDLVLKVKEKKLHGINVTVPFKKKIIPYLDKLTMQAENTGSVNTIYLKNGEVYGHNTDIDGFELGINKSKINLKEKKILILGAGGVVPSIIYALNKMNVSEIIISNRTKNKAENLKTMFNNLTVIDWGELPNFDMIINATSIGLKKEDKINLDFSKINNNKIFYDVIYNPKETDFLKIGKKLGNNTINGKLMFIFQALASFKIWHNFEPKIDKETINLLDE